jgi:hypothetical protein
MNAYSRIQCIYLWHGYVVTNDSAAKRKEERSELQRELARWRAAKMKGVGDDGEVNDDGKTQSKAFKKPSAADIDTILTPLEKRYGIYLTLLPHMCMCLDSCAYSSTHHSLLIIPRLYCWPPRMMVVVQRI